MSRARGDTHDGRFFILLPSQGRFSAFRNAKGGVFDSVYARTTRATQRFGSVQARRGPEERQTTKNDRLPHVTAWRKVTDRRKVTGKRKVTAWGKSLTGGK